MDTPNEMKTYKMPSETLQKSYANVLQNHMYPKKESAVIIDSVEGLNVQEYTVAIGQIVGPENIRYVSRISQGRICFYLANPSIANKVTAEGCNKIKVKNHYLEIRPLITKTKRVIFSNVCPVIPNYVLIEKLKEFNINTSATITYIKAGINNPGYQHILSFRRQIYLEPNEIDKLPEHMSIIYDSTKYYVYISTDKISCFLCQKEGHTAKYCTRSENDETGTENVGVEPNENESLCRSNEVSSDVQVMEQENNVTDASKSKSSKQENNTEVEKDAPTSVEEIIEQSGANINSPSVSHTKVISVDNKLQSRKDTAKTQDTDKGKRLHSTNNSSISDSNEIAERYQSVKKKVKISSVPEDLVQHISETQNQISDTLISIFPIPMESAIDFIVKSYEHPYNDIPMLAKKYTENIPGLVIMLQEIHRYINKKNVKRRITTIMKKLVNNEQESEVSTEELENKI